MENSKLIISYLEGELEGASLREFEARLETDSSLRTELESYQMLYGDLEEMRSSDVTEREVLAALEAETSSSVGNNAWMEGQWKWWGIAAAILLLCAVLFWARPVTNAEYYKDSYPGMFLGTGVDRSGGRDAERRYGKALGLYEKGQYSDALAAFESVPLDFKAYKEGLLYQGSCLLLLGRPQETIQLITPLAEEEAVGEYALWFLAIAHLHAGEVDAAKQVLEKMTAVSGDFKDEEAARILRKLSWGI